MVAGEMSLKITNSTPAVREVVAEVCDIVAECGARLSGAGKVGIIKKLDRSANQKSVITVEGGFYEHTGSSETICTTVFGRCLEMNSRTT
ncbi:hypothetical protein RJ640_025000 [Escallonia rubra]|uniref:Phosphotransferase n=1 Tax=Escallonia rubra TaxID=112253 RepID=A0AA88RB46_9ASTE|nr:hypothetical protein RJ640_025000 [Escallonia rubra]